MKTAKGCFFQIVIFFNDLPRKKERVEVTTEG